jgi:hypothetical protein
MNTRARIAAYGSAVALIAAGIICGAAISADAGQYVGFALIGLGGITLVSLVFLEIGLSEDRERAEAERRGKPRRARKVPQLGRSRGRRRRLG